MRSIFPSFLKSLSVATAVFALMAAIPAHADTVAYTDGAGQGTQLWTGNLAFIFQVNAPITVDALGAFNALGDGVINGPITVGIFSGPYSLVTSAVFQGTYTPVGYDVFQSVTPVVLGPGTYELDWFETSTDLNGNKYWGSNGAVLNSGGGAITFLGAGYNSAAGFENPGTYCNGCVTGAGQANQWDAGTFAFTSATPEPDSLVLLGTGLLSVGALVRRRLTA